MASTYLSKTFSSSGTSDKIWTMSVWVKKNSVSSEGVIFSAGSSEREFIRFESNAALTYRRAQGTTFEIKTNRLFRDVNFWYHIVIAVDTSQSTNTNRYKLYINGVQETSFATATYMSQNYSTKIGANQLHTIGKDAEQGTYFDGCMSHFHFVDGSQLAPTVFGETDATTGEWKIKTSPSYTAGTNGFWVLKDGNSVTDQSSNSNDFTVSGGTLTNTEDCPSNVYTTWNGLPYAASSRIQSGGWANGSTYIATTTSNESCSFPSSLAFNGTGKYYIEFKVGNAGGDFSVGIGETDAMDYTINNTSSKLKFCNYSKGWAYTKGGNKENNGSGSSYGDSFTDYDYIGLAYNNGSLWFSKNGTWQNSATASEIAAGTTTNAAYTGLDTSVNYYIMFDGYNDAMIEMNAGNGYFRTTEITSPNNPSSGDTGAKFKYPVPTGLQPISTKGLNE